MSNPLNGHTNFRSLSLRDLLEARDLYHFHLMNKTNVVGTAVGLYLIRKEEPYPHQSTAEGAGRFPKAPHDRPERTLEGSEVRDYSWPCVLVFVREWTKTSRFGTARTELHPQELVPTTLYMPDGRIVPVCVVKVEQGEPDESFMPEWHFPDGKFGGGMPIIVRPQQTEHRATIGCLVSDGHTTYALTSRHACGPFGEPAYALRSGTQVQIGTASRLHLTRLPFEEVYPHFSSRHTYINLDAGLIELSDLNDWTSQVFGLEQQCSLADLNELNLTLRLIDQPVVTNGAASGRIEGRIKALFYRYMSIGGYDYVCDFLIAPETAGMIAPDSHASAGRSRNKRTSSRLQTHPGDSGAIWHLVTEPEDSNPAKVSARKNGAAPNVELRPLAIQWGGQVFMNQSTSKQYAFALATSLTSVCRLLNVELVREHDTGVKPYWGQTGHYSIASFAVDALSSAKLNDFLTTNIDRISFTIAKLTPKEIAAQLKDARENGGFVPLADVPDVVWKKHESKMDGGRDNRWVQGGRSTGPEHPTHYADIDEPCDWNGATTTLRQLCLDDIANLSVEIWQRVYDDLGHTQQRTRGLLPFRVWQFFDSMVDFLKLASPRQATQKFLCAAGLVSHYVGDACQPLHGSVFSDGYSDRPTTETHHKRDTGEEYVTDSHEGAGVHSLYESHMIDRYAPEIVDKVPRAITTLNVAKPLSRRIKTGRDAAAEIIDLMERSAQAIRPQRLVDAYLSAGGTKTAAVRDSLWREFGGQTIKVMADGARVLARIWEAAWIAGRGNRFKKADLSLIDLDELRALYTDEEFVPSLDLDHIAGVLK